MSCSLKESGYFCSCQGWFRELLDYIEGKWSDWKENRSRNKNKD